MSEGIATTPVVLTENPALFAEHDAKMIEEIPNAVNQDLNRQILSVLGGGREEQMIAMLKRASMDEINNVPATTWAAVVPTLAVWIHNKGSEKQVMAYSIAYHIMQHCPNVYRRPDLAKVVARITAICRSDTDMGLDLSMHGGLAHQELQALRDHLTW